MLPVIFGRGADRLFSSSSQAYASLFHVRRARNLLSLASLPRLSLTFQIRGTHQIWSGKELGRRRLVHPRRTPELAPFQLVTKPVPCQSSGSKLDSGLLRVCRAICPRQMPTVAFRVDLIWFILHVVVNGWWLITSDVKSVL